MVFKLSAFCTDAGADLIADYCRSVLQREPPAVSPGTSRHRYGKAIERAIRGWSPKTRQRFIGNLRRVALLTDSVGQDCLRQSFPDPGAWPRLLLEYRSARKRALFCFLNHEAMFRIAEARHFSCVLRTNAQFCDTWPVERDIDPEALEIPKSFRISCDRQLSEVFGEQVEVRYDHHAITVDHPRSERPAFQLHLAVKDMTEALPLWGRYDTVFAYPGIERAVILTYYPAYGLLMVCGKKLTTEGRQALAELFTLDVLKSADIGERLRVESYLLEHALALDGPTWPPRLGLVSAGFTEVRFSTAISTRATTQTLDPSRSILDSIEASLGADVVRRLRHGARVHRLRFCFTVRGDQAGEQDQRVDATLTRHGLGVSTHVDAHLAITIALVDHWRMRLAEAELPLLRTG